MYLKITAFKETAMFKLIESTIKHKKRVKSKKVRFDLAMPVIVKLSRFRLVKLCKV